MTAAGPMVAQAHAKLNFGLWVTGRRDDGFHEIDTLFVRLELHDELSFTRASDVRGEVAAAAGIALGGLTMDRDNLVVQAVRAFQRDAGEELGVRIELRKRIPLAAGLGGGSSDAAQTLLAMARLYPADLDLHALALELGSDLPFFLSGSESAWASGRGESLEPVRLPPLPVVLLNPCVRVSASEGYGLIEGFDPAPDRTAFLERLWSSQEPGYRNTLEPGVVEKYRVVGDAMEALRDAGLRGVLMSGSGSTCFGIAESEQEALLVSESLQARYPEWWVWSGLAAV